MGTIVQRVLAQSPRRHFLFCGIGDASIHIDRKTFHRICATGISGSQKRRSRFSREEETRIVRKKKDETTEKRDDAPVFIPSSIEAISVDKADLNPDPNPDMNNR